MLLDFAALYEKHGLVIHDVLHIGAHFAEEASIYSALGIEKVMWVEPNTALLLRVAESLAANNRINDIVQWDLIADEDNKEIEFHITNLDGLSSSIFEFGTHPEFSPEIVFDRTEQHFAITVDTLLAKFDDPEKPWNINMLNMDIQGAELLALKGAQHLLPNLDIVMTEVNEVEVYQGCAKIWEIDEMLGQFGLERVETLIVPGQGWGDALYLRP